MLEILLTASHGIGGLMDLQYLVSGQDGEDSGFLVRGMERPEGELQVREERDRRDEMMRWAE